MTDLTIIIPFFNSERTIGRSLDSLAAIPAESRRFVEIILVDDASTDGGAALVGAWQMNAGWGRVICLHQTPNAGSGAARNRAFAQATSTWILMLDADDELLLDPMPAIRGAGDATALLFPVERYRDGRFQRRMDVSPWSPADHLQCFTAGNPLTVSSALFRRAALRDMFVEPYRYLEDWVFWIMNPGLFERARMGADQPLARIHAHGRNKSGDQRQHGEWRERVACDLLRTLPALSLAQLNNLKLQVAIGRMQAGKRIGLTPATLIPCDPVLYLKFMVHRLMGKRASLDYTAPVG